MSWSKTRFSVIFGVGAAILVIGFALQLYPTSVIDGLKNRLKDSTLSSDERSKLEGALNSWNVWQITTFQPLSSLLFAVGIIIIVYSVISGAFGVASSYKVVKKEAEA
jgi:hypothetical protein